MIRQFNRQYEEQRFRADRALIWCAFEGSEIQDVMFDLYRIWDLHGVGPDEDTEIILAMMERWALHHALYDIEDNELPNVRTCLRHLRQTGELHPELAVRT